MAPASQGRTGKDEAAKGRAGFLPLEFGQAVLAFLFFIVVSGVFSWPLLGHLSNSLPDWGDPPDTAWRIGSIARQLFSDPLHLYRTNGFYPLGNGLALNEIVTGEGLLAGPVVWWTGNVILAYNLINFSSFVLSGFAMWLLVRFLTGSNGAGLVAGLIYAFSPVHLGQYGHLGLGAQEWMVFALYFLIKGLRKPGLNLIYWAGFVGCFVFQALAAGYYSYFETILIACYLLFHFVFEAGLPYAAFLKGRSRLRTAIPSLKSVLFQAGKVLLALSLAFILILPFALPFIQAKDDYDFERSLQEISYWSAAPNSLLRTMGTSWLYHPVERNFFHLKTSAERMMYPGLIALLLALAGLFLPILKNPPRDRRGQRKDRGEKESFINLRWFFAFISLVGLILSFGPSLNLEAYGLKPTGIILPYRFLYEIIPGFNSLRVAQRFDQLFMLGLAICAGYGVWTLQRNYWGRRFSTSFGARLKVFPFKISFPARFNPGSGLLTLLCLGLVGGEFYAPGLPLTPTFVGPGAPALYRWLDGPEADGLISKAGPLIELPLGQDKNPATTSQLYLMYGLGHGRPMLNGSANIIPAGYERLYFEMQSFPAPSSLDILTSLGVQTIIVHPLKLVAEANRQALVREAGPGGRLELIREFKDNFDNEEFQGAVYRLKAAPERFAALVAAIPPGAEVFLADSANHLRLFTTVLPNLLGTENRRYFSSFETIYDNLEGGIQPASPGHAYQFGLFYHKGGLDPATYGFSPEQLIFKDKDNSLDLYGKST